MSNIAYITIKGATQGDMTARRNHRRQHSTVRKA